MRRAIPLAAVAAALLTAWISFSRAQDAQRAGGNAARTWEYHVVVLSEIVDVGEALRQGPAKTGANVESKFNALGREGWEFCGELPGVAMFKRPAR